MMLSRPLSALGHRVMLVLNEWDLMGLAPGAEDGAPLSEYEVEARAIAQVLFAKGHIARRDVCEIWMHWFSEEPAMLDEAWDRFLMQLDATLITPPRP